MNEPVWRRIVHDTLTARARRGDGLDPSVRSWLDHQSEAGNPGDQLVFPACQTHRDGEQVAWTGGPDAEMPASRLTLTAPAAG